MNRFGGQSSPWASGAPPMYGHNSHAPPPPPQYGTPAYGQTSGPWNVPPQPFGGRQTAGGWGSPSTHIMQPQRRPQFNLRPPMSGPTGKRGNQGWDGPPNKRTNRGGRGGGGHGGNWRQGNNQNKQNRNFNNNRNNRNNREVNRSKQNDTQLERRQQHDLAQKAAESLTKKEYPIETPAKSDDDKSKTQDIDSAQEKYLLAVFGYVCQVCSVFLKDKSARFDHCQTEEHSKNFNKAEDDRIKKEESDKKGETVTDEQNKAKENSDETIAEDSSQKLKNGDKAEANESQTQEKLSEENEKTNEEVVKESVTQSEEIKTEEKAVIGEQTNDEKEDKPSESNPPTGAAVAETPASVPNSQNSDNFSGAQQYNQNRGRGYNRGRGNQGGRGRGGGGGRGRNRGRGRK